MVATPLFLLCDFRQPIFKLTNFAIMRELIGVESVNLIMATLTENFIKINLSSLL